MKKRKREEEEQEEEEEEEEEKEEEEEEEEEEEKKEEVEEEEYPKYVIGWHRDLNWDEWITVKWWNSKFRCTNTTHAHTHSLTLLLHLEWVLMCSHMFVCSAKHREKGSMSSVLRFRIRR